MNQHGYWKLQGKFKMNSISTFSVSRVKISDSSKNLGQVYFVYALSTFAPDSNPEKVQLFRKE